MYLPNTLSVTHALKSLVSSMGHPQLTPSPHKDPSYWRHQRLIASCSVSLGRREARQGCDRVEGMSFIGKSRDSTSTVVRATRLVAPKPDDTILA